MLMRTQWKERFVRQFVWPNLQANALYQGIYPLATALARPLIAQLLVEVEGEAGEAWFERIALAASRGGG